VVAAALASAIVLVPAVVATRSAQAQTFTVLHSFTGGADGGSPWQGFLIRDPHGNLYGTTSAGGDLSCGGGGGCGVVFKISPKGKETVLYSFTGNVGDGQFPYAGLVRDTQGNLYGTTSGGGTNCAWGTVFKVDKTGKETVLYCFGTIRGDGENPWAGLLLDAKGNLFGTTEYGGGGSSNSGTVFMLDTTGQETVLHTFTGLPDGAYPEAGVTRDAHGNLYGTTLNGGASGSGTVFKLDKKERETVLHSFTRSGGDGGLPYGSVVRDAQGNLYGATEAGGTSDLGTVFMLDKTGKETVLYRFTGTGGDGFQPYAGLVRDGVGNLYGTTWRGGTYNAGTVFKVDKTGTETVLYSFDNANSGGYPLAGLVRDAKGNLYGTTSQGSTYGFGTVFKLTP